MTTDRRSLSSDINASELTGTREGAESRPREIERGAVGSSFGKVLCLVCDDLLGDELRHSGAVKGTTA